MYNWHISKNESEVLVTRVDRKTGEGFLAIRGSREDETLIGAILMNCRIGDLIFFSDRKVALIGPKGTKA